MDETIVVGVQNVAEVLVLVKDKKTGKESLEGVFNNIDVGEFKNQKLYEHISFRDRFNVSIKLRRSYDRNSDGLNDFINGSVDILEHEKDLSIAREHPDSLIPLSATGVDQPLLVTPYDCSLERSIIGSHKTDLLESLTGFRLDVWTITILSLIIIATLINIHIKINQVSKLRTNRTGGFWTIISFLLKNPSMVDINWVSSTLGTLVAIFTFFVGVCYFENIIKSDQISVYQPTVYTSFAMIAEDPRTQVFVASTLQTQFETFCEQEPPHSKYRKIFDENFKKFGMDKLYSLVKILHWFYSTPRDKKALILRDEPGTGSEFCKLKNSGSKQWNLDSLCIYEHVPQVGDPEKDELEVLIENQANLISVNFTRKKIFKRFLTYFNRAYEMGLDNEEITRQGEKLITPSIADCISRKPPVTHDRGSLPFDLYNYKFSFALILLLYSIALVILMFEIWHYRRYFSGNISHKNTRTSVWWEKSNESHRSIASIVQTMHYRDDFVKNLIQSVANRKSKLTDVKSEHNSKIEKHQICTAESNDIQTDIVETDTIKTDTIKTDPTRLNHTKKIVTQVDVHSSSSTSQGVSSGEKIKKNFGRKKIVPVFDDRILTQNTETKDSDM